jgi:hypothetical protein
LREVDLKFSKVTDLGAKELEAARPELHIRR